MTIKSMLADIVRRYGRKTAVVMGEQRLSYNDLAEASNRIANALIKMGVKKGDRIVVAAANSPEFIATFFGIIKLGAIAVLLDPKYKNDELTLLFNDCLPKVLVTESSTLEQLSPILAQFKSIEHVINLDSEGDGSALRYREVLARSSDKEVEVELVPEDTAVLAYTSGPTFTPRGVLLSHHSLVAEAEISSRGFQQTENDRMMLYALPMHHVFGLVAAMLASIYTGSTVVIVPGTGLSISSFMATIEKEKGTMFLGVPYIFALAVDLAEKEGIKNDLSSLRLCSSSGAPLSVDIIQRFKKQYGYQIIDCWGSTEAICHVTCMPIDSSGPIGSVGRALPGWEVKVVDDNNRELPPNTDGELVIRGPIMKGYYNKPQATAEIVVDGWLHNGDIGRVDENGYFFITGRKKDMIIVKGQNIYTSDIEGVLQSHPAVAEAAVLGIHDDMRGEIIGAVISLNGGEAVTEQDIKKHCTERMVNYKVPKQVMFLDSLPRNASNRIDKGKIREILSIPSVFQPRLSP